MTASAQDSLEMMLRQLKLPSFLNHYPKAAVMAEREGWSFARYLHHLVETELEERSVRRIDRYLRQSGLPLEKTPATLDLRRLPLKVRRQFPMLCEGGFVERAHNVLAFGKPGRGKTHLLCAIAWSLVQRGYRVLFIPGYKLVQRLLVAKRELLLEREFRRLDKFDVICIDDIGYVQQDREEMEVLFTFLSERYERRSVMISSNLVFSQWDQIFKNPMTAAAAIDRLVQYSIILELTGPSVRAEEAKKLNGGEATDTLDAGADSATHVATDGDDP